MHIDNTAFRERDNALATIDIPSRFEKFQCRGECSTMKRGRIKYLLDEKLNILRMIFLHYLYYFSIFNIPETTRYISSFEKLKMFFGAEANKDRKQKRELMG